LLEQTRGATALKNDEAIDPDFAFRDVDDGGRRMYDGSTINSAGRCDPLWFAGGNGWCAG